jgi:hypothetical protein
MVFNSVPPVWIINNSFDCVVAVYAVNPLISNLLFSRSVILTSVVAV